MARSWNDALYGPPPRRNATQTKAQPVDVDDESESDSDGEYAEHTLTQAKPHRCYSLWCKCDLTSEQSSTTKANSNKKPNAGNAAPQRRKN